MYKVRFAASSGPSFYLSIANKPSVGNFPEGTADPKYKKARDTWAQGLLGAWFPWFQAITLYFVYKFVRKTKIVDPALADLDSGRWIPKEEDLDDRPRPKWKKVLARFV